MLPAYIKLVEVSFADTEVLGGWALGLESVIIQSFTERVLMSNEDRGWVVLRAESLEVNSPKLGMVEA